MKYKDAPVATVISRLLLIGLVITQMTAWPGLLAEKSLPTLSGTVTPNQSSEEQPTYEGEPISLRLVNVSLTDFFRTISELSGLNILIDPDVKGRLTINVESVPWDQLFDWVLKSHSLDRTIEGNLVRIATKATLRREQVAKLQLKAASFKAEDTTTVTIPLNYAVSSDLAKTLENQLSERGLIDVDERTNTLIVTDTQSSVDNLNGLIDVLDVPEPQVEIEASVVEMTETFARELGAALDLDLGKITDRVQGTGLVRAFPTSAVGSANIRVGKLLDTVRLDALITAAESEGVASIKSRPRIAVQNNTEAVITQGSKIPIPVVQNFTTRVRFETAALQVTVTPQITEENTIILKIKVENNVPDFSQTVLGIPTILTSESRTVVLLPDGGTTIIAGVKTDIARSEIDMVPGLGKIPVVGNLFKRTSRDTEVREILFKLTANIRK